MTQKQQLCQLLNHPIHETIFFCSKSRCFKRKKSDTEIKVKGLLPVLKKSCWSNYEYTPSEYKTKKTGIWNSSEGIARGTRVHKEIEVVVNRGWEEAKLFFGEKLHPFTTKAIIAMREWKWQPIISEMIAYDPFMDVATKIDLICLDKNKDIVLVEWKCGMDNYISRGNAPMQGPLGKYYSNSPLHQAYVQLLFTKMFVEKGYGVFPKKSYVIQIHTDGITPYTIPETMKYYQESVYEYVLFCRRSAKKNNK